MDIIGTYRLLTCEMLWSDGKIEAPYGASPEGLLVYTPDGYVTGHVMRTDVPRLSAAARRAPSDELSAAFLGYLGYYGTYSLDANTATVTHHVLGSWHPNWVGTDQLRHVRRVAGRLVIETPEIPSGGRTYRTRLVWLPAD